MSSERNLDGMEAVKLNVFHWHISDDQGFRAQSLKFPLLTKDGSNGSYYTQAANARDHPVRSRSRHPRRCRIRYALPHHFLVCRLPESRQRQGSVPGADALRVSSMTAMDPTRESTYQFIDTFIGEMAALFPDAYFHIGGDECNGKHGTPTRRSRPTCRRTTSKTTPPFRPFHRRACRRSLPSTERLQKAGMKFFSRNAQGRCHPVLARTQGARPGGPRRLSRLLSNGYYIDLNQSAEYHYLVDPAGGRSRIPHP